MPWTARVTGAVVAVVVAVPAAAAAAPTFGPSPNTPTGWGSQPQAVGRYHLLVSQTTTLPASRAPGVFAFAVDLMSDLTAAVGPASAKTTTAGELTVFMRKVKTGEPYAGSGILSVHLPNANFVLYLTELSSHGTARSAVVNKGAFVGDPIGHVSGRSTAPGHLTFTVEAKGIPSLHARLVRFSNRPTP
jgi:hypothetical protein